MLLAKHCSPLYKNISAPALPIFASRKSEAIKFTRLNLWKTADTYLKSAKNSCFPNASADASGKVKQNSAFIPLADVLQISEAIFDEISVENSKTTRVEAVKRAELRFSRNSTVYSGETSFWQQKKRHKNKRRPKISFATHSRSNQILLFSFILSIIYSDCSFPTGAESGI